ncbi:MAG TPA: AMP-binding protein [Acidimicrobiales bacterium]|nr:AMP-binding protein [Acidimicrobiales bacterium]
MAVFGFAEVWEGVARARGDSPALAHGQRTVSWTELDRRADALASAFLAAGFSHQDKVANYLYNCPEYLEALFATVKAGLVPVNTNYRYGPDELVYLWDNADAVAVVFDAAFTDMVDSLRGRVPKVKLWVRLGDAGSCPEWAIDYDTVVSQRVPGPVAGPWGRRPEDLIFVYTGGTTGMPKGVMWQQGDLGRGQAAARGAQPPETVQDIVSNLAPEGPVMLAASPLMHATAMFTAFGTLRQGGCVVTLESRGLDPVELLDAVVRNKANSVVIVGDVFARPVLRCLDDEPGRWDLESLRAIISSGVMWSEPIKQGLLKHKPSLILFDSLGSSEAPGLGQSVSSGDGVIATASFKLGETARIITDDGRDVVPGSGEIGMLARTGAIPLGYYKDEAKTAATFRTIDGVRYVIPGDFASVDEDGTVHLLGRGSQCINTGGEKVFPEEVEEVLKEHPAVLDVAVVGVPDEMWGEAVCALVQLRPDEQLDEAGLIEHVKLRLARYKAPKRVFAVASVGRAPSGKLDYRALRDQAVALSAS